MPFVYNVVCEDAPYAARTDAPFVEATPGGLTLRRCATRDDFVQCVALQEETWGAGFTDKVPVTVLELAQHLGGITAGAFDPGGRLLGFVFGITGRLGGRPVHWSDILAVRPDGRDRGIGTLLKRYQRALLRGTDVETIYWTFDPLIARNAHLNLARLGARAVQYVRDMYGPNTGSELHSGLGTDRLVAAWPVHEPADHDGATPDAGEAAPGPVVNPAGADGRPAFAPADAPHVRVAIPDDIQQVKRDAPDVAPAWRVSTREAFVWYFARGYAVAGFRAERGRGGAYHLARTAATDVAPRAPLPDRDPFDTPTPR